MPEPQDNLDALLDCWRLPPLRGDLTARILAQAAAEDDTLDELLAQADPKVTLQGDLTERILARARQEEADLDRVLASADRVPPLRGDLSRSVLGVIRRRRLRGRIVAIAGSLAVAAAIAIVTLLLHGPQPRPPVVVTDLPTDEQLIVNNLDLIRDWKVLVHWDTIRAMEQLEGEAPEGNSL